MVYYGTPWGEHSLLAQAKAAHLDAERADGIQRHFRFDWEQVAACVPAYGAYVASKAAGQSISLILARELRGKDITVNTVAPGPVATPLFLEGKDEATVAAFAQATPLERLGEPGDIAETVAFLAGPARWVNGQVIFTNGGLA